MSHVLTVPDDLYPKLAEYAERGQPGGKLLRAYMRDLSHGWAGKVADEATDHLLMPLRSRLSLAPSPAILPRTTISIS